MKAKNEKLPHKQQKALVALLSCATAKEAAETAGISDVTLFRWRQEPPFEAAYRHARRLSMENAITSLQSASSQAVDTLKFVMADEAAPASCRISAARCILEMAMRGR